MWIWGSWLQLQLNKQRPRGEVLLSAYSTKSISKCIYSSFLSVFKAKSTWMTGAWTIYHKMGNTCKCLQIKDENNRTPYWFSSHLYSSWEQLVQQTTIYAYLLWPLIRHLNDCGLIVETIESFQWQDIYYFVRNSRFLPTRCFDKYWNLAHSRGYSSKCNILMEGFFPERGNWW